MKNVTTDYLQWIDKCAADLRTSGRYGQAINYKKAGRSFARFLESRGLDNPTISDITPALVRDYNVWLEGSGIVRNSISFYNRQLRAIYNLAVKKGKTRDRRPFAEVYTGVAKTCKRAISLKEISKICSVLDSSTSIARDMFEFSFATCGMTFADMVYLKKNDIHDGVLIYFRRKTRTQVRIPLNDAAKRIIKKYSYMTVESPYVFPILGKEKGEKAYKKYLSALTEYNRALKVIAKKANSRVTLTSYVARHSWASVARNAGAPVSVISSALGHSSEKTTQIYLDSMDLSKIAQINRKISREMRPFMTKRGSYEEPRFILQKYTSLY